jgi:hypothetical protein
LAIYVRGTYGITNLKKTFMINAKMYLTNEMAEYVINEFARNNVNYDDTQHFVGNYIFTAAIAFANTFIGKAKRQVTADQIINSAINTPKVKVEEVRQVTGNNYFVVTMGEFISTSNYKDEDREKVLAKVMELVTLLESGNQDKRTTIYESR